MGRDGGGKRWFSVLGEEEKALALDGLARGGRTVHVWRKGMAEKDVRPHAARGFDRASWTLTVAPRKAPLLASLLEEDLTGLPVLCRFVHGGAHHFAQSVLGEGPDPGSRLLRLDGDVFRGSRREDYRLAASPRVTITFAAGGDEFPCEDISAGGLGLLFDPARHPGVRKGAVLEGGLLRLRGVPYPIPALAITGIYEGAGPDARSRAGGAFVDLPHQTAERLFVQVNAEARADAIQQEILGKKTEGGP